MNKAQQRERHLSKRFADLVKPVGFAVRIESSHTIPGFPDWQLFLESGKTALVELKDYPNTVSIGQLAVHNRLRKLGHSVFVLTQYPASYVVLGHENRTCQTLKEAVNYILEQTYGTN